MARNGPLPLSDGPVESSREGSPSPVVASKADLVAELGKVVQSTKVSPKCRQRATLGIGYLGVGDPDFSHGRTALETLLQTAFQSLDVEAHIDVAEAMCCIVLGPACPVARDLWTEFEHDYQRGASPRSEETLAWLLQEILDKYVFHTKPSVRQAVAVWLSTLLQRCGHLSAVKTRLSAMQKGLLNLLADSNDIVQGLAGKAVSQLYPLCDEDVRKELVGNLVEALMSGQRSKVSVTDDTLVFQEGQLGLSPTGGQLTTYRELCSLASDLNQPDLMYKFMHLASHNALWNSKKGAAFGLSGIADAVGLQLEEHLPKIVPKLYRYQYDPASYTRDSFSSIWRAIVPDPQKTVNKYFQEILADLLSNLTNPHWRVRESCCLALCDLLQGRQFPDVAEHLPALWETCFRVRDDIKESVRNAAESALKSLSKASVHWCDANVGKHGQTAVGVILPCLVKSGLGSGVSEVQLISLQTIVKISKSAGSALKPHLPLLMVSLLESLSALESPTINYLGVRLESQQTTADKLDAARVAAAFGTPMMDTIKMCIQYVDEDVLTELVPRLVDLIRHSIGLATKAGCSSVVIAVTTQCPRQLHDHASKLLAAFLHHLTDRNAVVRHHYALAVGHLARVSKDKSVEKVIGKISDWYMERTEETIRHACGQTLLSICRHAPDVLKRHATRALPLAFFAMHEKKKVPDATAETSPWEEVWTDSAVGSESVRLYLDEITTLVRRGLESQSWTTKEQAAACLVTVSANVGNEIDPTRLAVLVDAVLAGLAGRIWTGKESLPTALSSLCVNCSRVVLRQERPPPIDVDQVVRELLRECLKESPAYRQAAMKGLAAVLETYRLDYFDEFFAVLRPPLTADANGNTKEEEDEEKTRRESRLEFHSAGVEALAKAWPDVQQTQAKHLQPLCEAFSAIYVSSTWKVQWAVLKALNSIIPRTQIPMPVDDRRTSPTSTVFDLISRALATAKYKSLQTEALSLTENILSKLKGNDTALTLESAERLRNGLRPLTEDGNANVRSKALEVMLLLSSSTA